MENERTPSEVIELNLTKVGWMSMLITVLSTIILLGFYAFLNNGFEVSFTLLGFFLFIFGYVLLIILHELFHLVGFRLFGAVKWKEMDVGVNLKLGIAYATTKKPIRNKGMKLALLLPFWTTGVIPAVIGFTLGSPGLIFLSAWLIGGASGDFAMYKALRKVPNDAWIKDDPQKPKLYVYK
ncbi:DUF3267 domain-containing protein [Chungangia koreensis]|uniref:DUF3267 domain-containing protein n=1 Tax=Chungangia koreensis TaxID=752657 RepID=A0ABV8X6V9_9LACT